MLDKLDYLIAGFILLLLLYYHSNKELKIDNINNKIFRCFLTLSMLDILFDMITSILIAYPIMDFVWISILSLTIFYYFQVLVTYALALYALSLTKRITKETRKYIIYWSIMPFLMILFITGNIVGKYIFSFDSVGFYAKQPLYPVMYIYTLIYTMCILAFSLLNFNKANKQYIIIVVETIIIGGVCTVLQFLLPGYLLTGFGISLGVLVLFLKINHPSLYTDALTNTYNKSYFDYWYSELSTQQKDVHLIGLELTGLKRANLMLGVKKGDSIIVQIATWLTDHTHCQVFRTGGNRFILGTYSIDDYYKAIELIENEFINSPGNALIKTYACAMDYAQKKFPSSSILSYLDYMVSLAAKANSSKIVLDSEQTYKSYEYEKEIEKFLTKAIDEDLFELAFQPIVSTDTGRIISLEALSRLRHPVYGYISPEFFITLAEKNNTIDQIGLLQFKKIADFVVNHKDELEDVTSVKCNLSPMQFINERHILDIINVVKNSGMPSSLFEFEITETVETDYNDALKKAVLLFKEAGLNLSLDDFGSGYANLNTVLKLPFTSVKMDRSLLFDISTNSKAAEFYRNIVFLLNNLGYFVISEGVETKEEYDIIRTWGVKGAQGYYLSPPVNEQKILQKMKEQYH